MKYCTFDIETWDLAAPFGPLICASTLCHDGRMITYRMDDYIRSKDASDTTDDLALLLDLRSLLESHHITAGWYSKGFDIPHINTRLVMHGERPMESRLHVDGIWQYKGWRGLKTMSAKLKYVSRFYGFEEKPDLDPDVWLKARIGNKQATNEVVERCEADVRITAAIIDKSFDLNLIRNIQRYP